MTGSPKFGIGTVREAVRQRVDSSSLRAVATEIGMSWSGLRSFLQGGSPHPATREKLIAWYADARDREELASARDDIDAAIDLLGLYVRKVRGAAARRRRLEEVVERIESAARDGNS